MGSPAEARIGAGAWALAGLTCALVCGHSGSARAWTDAAVRGVDARVELAGDASAHVTLTMSLRVHGGWLEGLELNGLDEDLVLDPEVPVVAVHEDGQRFVPEVRVLSGGRVQLDFRRSSPRRGALIVILAYTTSLAHRATMPIEGEDRVRVRWTLPGWSAGLDGPSIEVVAPLGTRLSDADAARLEGDLEVDERVEDGHAILRWRRAHLPRTMPWSVSVEVPSEALDEALRGAPTEVLPTIRTLAQRDVDPRPFWLALAGWLALLVLSKIAAVSHLARRGRSRARPLVPCPWWLRAGLVASLALVGGLVGPEVPAFGLGALALVAMLGSYRVAVPAGVARLGGWRPVDARWTGEVRRGAVWRWFDPRTLVDATTPLGAVHLACVLAFPWIGVELPVPPALALLASLVALPVFVSGTRLAFPVGPRESLRRLLAFTRRVRAVPDGVALRPVLHVTTDGEIQDARVRTAFAHRPEGLLRADLAIGATAHLGGSDPTPVLLVLTRGGTPADEALERSVPDAARYESASGRRVLRVVPIRDRRLDPLVEILDAFASCPAAPVNARGQTRAEDTNVALPPPTAVGF
ncbi:MAG: hypothetical protein AB7S26_33630 [Sandaracinaceae bacterium]